VTRIDPNVTWALLVQRLAHEENPRFRAQLETVIRHMQLECLDDVPGVLATVRPDARYDFYDNGPAAYLVLNGHQEIGAWYESQVSRRLAFEFDLERLVVDDGVIITEGINKAALYGAWVRDTLHVEVEDPDSLYYSQGRSIVVWPFADDGLLAGELVYRGWNDPPEKIARQKLARGEVADLAPALLPG